MNKLPPYAQIVDTGLEEDTPYIGQVFKVVGGSYITDYNTTPETHRLHGVTLAMPYGDDFFDISCFNPVETCACGNHPVAPGKRVCAECADARNLYPALFGHDLPDETA